jgi:hypothetical protein
MTKLTGGIIALLLCVVSHAQTRPSVFFTDIESGPGTGGEGNNGAFVTIYGQNFGSTRDTSKVTIGGVEVASYRIWGAAHLWYEKIVVQLGPSVPSGAQSLVITTPNGSSASTTFTVRDGRIYFVSKTGSDSNDGSFSRPFATPTKAKEMMRPGDVTYMREGNWSTEEQFKAVLTIFPEHSGTAGRPVALLAYPGEKPSIDTTVDRGIQLIGHSGSSAPTQYWVIGGLRIFAYSYAIFPAGAEVNHLRIVGNDLRQRVNGCGIEAEYDANSHVIIGNDIHHNGDGKTKSYSIYYAGFGKQNDIDIAWNALHDNPVGKGIQVYGHTAGDSISNLRIHDNAIYNNCMSGMVLGGSDGTANFIKDVLVYNNLIYNNGACHPEWSYPGVQIQNYGSGSTGIGAYQLYNNTFYNNAAPYRNAINILQSGNEMTVQGGIGSLVLKNNIFNANSGSKSYIGWDDTAAQAKVSGNNNLWFGKGAGPSQTTGNLGNDPLFVNAAVGNFRLQAASPAINAGVTIASITHDIEAFPRLQGTAVDLGAFEFAGSSSTSLPCDVSGDHRIDNTDVTLAIDQTLARVPCTSADIDKDGQCTVVDVQRVINARSGSCRVTP